MIRIPSLFFLLGPAYIAKITRSLRLMDGG
jgi:hypothetical protein